MSAPAGRIQVYPEQLLRFAHPAACCYEAALDDIQTVFDRYHISWTPLRAAHFAAQVLYESGVLGSKEECLDYHAGAIVRVWPKKFPPIGSLDPHRYAGHPAELAELVYGGRYGNTDPGDGYRYRGRGLLQLTFKDNYAAATRALRKVNPAAPDLCANPDLVFDAKWALEIAAALWMQKRCNHLADCDKLAMVTHRICGGNTGIHQRRKWLQVMKPVFNA